MYKIKKWHKKIVVMDENDNVVYYPPNFLRPINSRYDMQMIVDSFNDKGYNIDVIMEFETKFNPKIKVNLNGR